MRANKRMHGETAALLYRQKFFIQDTEVLRDFLAWIGPHNIARLRHVVVLGWDTSGPQKPINADAFAFLSSAPKLHDLKLACPLGFVKDMKFRLTQLFRALKPYYDAVEPAEKDTKAVFKYIKVHAYNWQYRGFHGDVLRDEAKNEKAFRVQLQLAMDLGHLY